MFLSPAVQRAAVLIGLDFMGGQRFFKTVDDILTGGETVSPMGCGDSDDQIDIPDF
jgi:hypothetical protein